MRCRWVKGKEQVPGLPANAIFVRIPCSAGPGGVLCQRLLYVNLNFVGVVGDYRLAQAGVVLPTGRTSTSLQAKLRARGAFRFFWKIKKRPFAPLCVLLGGDLKAQGAQPTTEDPSPEDATRRADDGGWQGPCAPSPRAVEGHLVLDPRLQQPHLTLTDRGRKRESLLPWQSGAGHCASPTPSS